METTFDFAMKESEYVYDISSNIKLCIKRINHSVAILYFTDEMSNMINIPDGIVVYTFDYQNTQKRVSIKPTNKTYALCWTDDYTIQLNNNVLINITNQRKWVISQLEFRPKLQTSNGQKVFDYWSGSYIIKPEVIS